MSYGVYAWGAAVAPAQVVADLLAIAAGELSVAALSASCDKPNSSIAGAAPGWSVLDAAYGAIAAPGVAGGPGMQLRVQVSGTSRLQVQPCNGWNVVSHAAAFAGAVADVSLPMAAPGSLFFVATPAGILLGAVDWSVWALNVEVKRDAPPISGDATGQVQVRQDGSATMPRVKLPIAVGDTTTPLVECDSSYRKLSALAARDRGEALYLPMVPLTVAYGSVPVGEVAGAVAVGGYATSGDVVNVPPASAYRVARTSAGLLIALPQV